MRASPAPQHVSSRLLRCFATLAIVTCIRILALPLALLHAHTCWRRSRIQFSVRTSYAQKLPACRLLDTVNTHARCARTTSCISPRAAPCYALPRRYKYSHSRDAFSIAPCSYLLSSLKQGQICPQAANLPLLCDWTYTVKQA